MCKKNPKIIRLHCFVDEIEFICSDLVVNDVDEDEEKIKDFRDQLKKKELKKSSQKKKLLKSITSPKGVRQRDGNLQTNSPIDKGTELLDCDGESYRMTKLMSNLNLMTKSTTIKLKMQQILLVIIKSPTNSYS